MANWNITVLANDYQGIEHTMPYFNDARYYCQSLGKTHNNNDRQGASPVFSFFGQIAKRQRHLTVNQTLRFRRFESFSTHHMLGLVKQSTRCAVNALFKSANLLSQPKIIYQARLSAICSHRQAVKSQPFQGYIAGSNPTGNTICRLSSIGRATAL